MVSWFGKFLPREVIVKFDATEKGMFEKLGRITGFSDEELIRKAVRMYYFGFTDGFNCRVMVDESETTED